jgi:ribonuclease D
MSTLVSSPAALAAITARARQCGIAAIDTEFVWTRTFYPGLGIIQIALAEGEAYLVDAPAVEDKTALAELLSAPDVVKILHDASSDLTILNRFCGALPCNIFDLRLAAGFCGLTATLSLGRLLQALLGIELAKTESLTDWLARPLSAAQIEYAVDDVRHMPEMYRCLLARLCEHGTQEWAREEMRVYESPAAYVSEPPEKAYRNVKGMGRLGAEQLTLLRELAAWREREARTVDRPRGRILQDEVLIDLALHPPAVADDLRQGRRRHVRELQRHDACILACVEAARRLPREQWAKPQKCHLPAAVLKERSDAVLALVRACAETRGIDPTVAGSRKRINSLILSSARGSLDAHPLLSGWRGELLRAGMEPLLAAWSPAATLQQPSLFGLDTEDDGSAEPGEAFVLP